MAFSISDAANESLIPGVKYGRTIPPLLPNNYLSRKGLLNRINLTPSGITLISAPPGYGKTSLATELALSRPGTIFWLTVDESDVERNFYSHLIASIRNVIPSFAPWFNTNEVLSSTELISRITSEIQSHDKNYILIVDNNRTTNSYDDALAFRIVNAMPRNLHIIGLRRQSPSDTYSKLTSLTHFQFFGPQELKFDESEIEAVAQLHGIDLEDHDAFEIINSVGGWPSAIHLISHNISLGYRSSEILTHISTDENPLKFLFTEVLKVTPLDDLEILNILCLVEEFNLDIARYLLREKFSDQKIKDIALSGIFFLKTNTTEKNYRFNPFAREALLANHENDVSGIQSTHRQLSEYFETQGDYNFAINHAHFSGDAKRFQKLFREKIREVVWAGRGSDILRWARYLDTSTHEGVITRHVTELVGMLVKFDYLSAQAHILESKLLAKNPEQSLYISKREEAVKLHLNFVYGKFDAFDGVYEKSQYSNESENDIRILDKLSILRLAAGKAFIAQDFINLELILSKATIHHEKENSKESLYLLNAIYALSYFSKGEYIDAQEVALTVIDMSERYGWRGIYGPLDAMLIQALCQQEFLETDIAYESFKKVRNLALKWKQGPWFFLSDGYVARHLVLHGRIEESLEVIMSERERIKTLRGINELSVFVDLNELYIRYVLNDHERIQDLMDRLPDLQLVRAIKLSMQQRTGRKISDAEIMKLPSNTPASKIYKKIAQAENYINHEKIAIGYLTEALEIGSVTGAKETFLKQDPKILNLIIKIANQKPTLYLEELASEAVNRLKRNMSLMPGSRVKLTQREKEILNYLRTGDSIKNIGSTLHVSNNTMKTHLKNIYRKLDVDSRESAIERSKALYII